MRDLWVWEGSGEDFGFIFGGFWWAWAQFGMTATEFSTHNRQFFTTFSEDSAHIDILGKYANVYTCRWSRMQLKSFNRTDVAEREWNTYEKHAPEYIASEMANICCLSLASSSDLPWAARDKNNSLSSRESNLSTGKMNWRSNVVSVIEWDTCLCLGF